MTKAMPKAKGASRASKPRKSATESPPQAGAKAEPGVSEARPKRIAKADSDAPVQAYIAGMPGWQRDLGEGLDALIVRNVPNVRRAMK